MEITSFDVSTDHVVTLHMSDMPKMGVRTTNTTVYIAGKPHAPPMRSPDRGRRLYFLPVQLLNPARSV
jgi:hypothetical protein